MLQDIKLYLFLEISISHEGRKHLITYNKLSTPHAFQQCPLTNYSIWVPFPDLIKDSEHAVSVGQMGPRHWRAWREGSTEGQLKQRQGEGPRWGNRNRGDG